MPRDIEEFLKMAAQRRQQQKAQANQAARANRTTPPAGNRPPPPRPGSPPPRTPLRPATNDEIVVIGESAAEPDPYRQSVRDHVRSHIDTSSLSEHASRLGEEVALADDKLDARLHSTFDHNVGNLKINTGSALSTTTTTTARDVSPLARDLLEMLSNPQSIRQAILISEVLKRPTFDE